MRYFSARLQFLLAAPILCLLALPLAAYAEHPRAERKDIPDSQITAPRPANYNSPPAPPEAGTQIRKYAIDEPGKGASNFGMMPMRDDAVFYKFMADRLEYRNFEGEEVFLWDVTAWVGDDYNKLYLESEGEHVLDDKTESADVQLLYTRSVSSFWNLQGGVRYDIRPAPERFFAVLGVEGLAPQWIEVEGNLYLSEDADVSADLELEYDLLLSQRLIFQPRMELAAAVQDVKQYGVGSGLNSLELGARLRYEITREFAPYIGLSWGRKVGETANLAQEEGEEISKLFWLAGVKLWF